MLWLSLWHSLSFRELKFLARTPLFKTLRVVLVLVIAHFGLRRISLLRGIFLALLVELLHGEGFVVVVVGSFERLAHRLLQLLHVVLLDKFLRIGVHHLCHLGVQLGKGTL